MGFGLLIISCQSHSNPKRLGNPKIISTFRYLESSHEFSGQLTLFQRNQLDSLVPDAQLYHFKIDNQPVYSKNIDNLYHSYFISDTIMSTTFDLTLSPGNSKFPIRFANNFILPLNVIAMDSVLVIDWTHQAEAQALLQKQIPNTNLEFTFVLSDENKQTILKTVPLSENKIIITPEEFLNLKSGIGTYYTILKSSESKTVNTIDWQNKIEVYSPNYTVELRFGEEKQL